MYCMKPYPTGSPVFDELLEGGYEKGIITTVYGPAASGKSNLALLAVASAQNKVIFVDTEGSFSVDRLQQLAPDVEDILDRVILLKATTFEKQTTILTKLPDLITPDTDLVIVDSIASQYRAAIARGEDNLNNQLSHQINTLFRVAADHEIPALITTQVYANMEDGGVNLVGGDIIKYNSKCLIELRNEDGRQAILQKHRFLAPNKSVRFVIDTVGIYAQKEN